MQWYIRGESPSCDYAVVYEGSAVIYGGGGGGGGGVSTSFVYAVGYGGKKFTSFDYAMQWYVMIWGGGGGGGGGGVNKLRLHSDIWRDSEEALIPLWYMYGKMDMHYLLTCFDFGENKWDS